MAPGSNPETHHLRFLMIYLIDTSFEFVINCEIEQKNGNKRLFKAFFTLISLFRGRTSEDVTLNDKTGLGKQVESQLKETTFLMATKQNKTLLQILFLSLFVFVSLVSNVNGGQLDSPSDSHLKKRVLV